jgi:hypothetical protein
MKKTISIVAIFMLGLLSLKAQKNTSFGFKFGEIFTSLDSELTTSNDKKNTRIFLQSFMFLKKFLYIQKYQCFRIWKLYVYSCKSEIQN